MVFGDTTFNPIVFLLHYLDFFIGDIRGKGTISESMSNLRGGHRDPPLHPKLLHSEGLVSVPVAPFIGLIFGPRPDKTMCISGNVETCNIFSDSMGTTTRSAF